MIIWAKRSVITVIVFYTTEKANALMADICINILTIQGRLNMYTDGAWIKMTAHRQDGREDRYRKLSDAKAWLIKLQKDGRGYSSIRTVRGVVRPAFQMAADYDLIRKNPFEFQPATGPTLFQILWRNLHFVPYRSPDIGICWLNYIWPWFRKPDN